MHVVVAIVGYRNTNDVVACLAALKASTYPAFEVVICENGGAEAFERLRSAVPARLDGGQAVTVFMAERNLGFAGGVNACIAARPEADAWWILNPDAAPEPQALEALVEKLSDGSCDAVGCVLRFPTGISQGYGGLWRPWFARAQLLGGGRRPNDPIDAEEIERRQNFLMGASMLVGRRFIAEAGLMREDYFLYCEEVEWCVRAAKRGLRLGFAPKAVVIHLAGSTTGSSTLSRLAVYLGERNKMLLLRDQSPAVLPVAAVLAMVIHVVRSMRRKAWPQIGHGLHGLWAGLCNERDLPGWMRSAGSSQTPAYDQTHSTP